jgi:serine/threonine-protein kinase
MLADDLSRYLEGRPASAGGRVGIAGENSSKRNRLAVGAVGAIFLAVLIGAAVAIWQAQVAIAERARAEEANQLMASIFTDADPYGVAGGKVTAVDLLNQAHQRIAASKTASPERRLELLTLLAYTAEQLSGSRTRRGNRERRRCGSRESAAGATPEAAARASGAGVDSSICR